MKLLDFRCRKRHSLLVGRAMLLVDSKWLGSFSKGYDMAVARKTRKKARKASKKPARRKATKKASRR
jgi:hypothetical protein